MRKKIAYRNQIYGFSALWILFFHINNHFPVNIPIINSFLKVGNCGVDVFMFLSGYCLTVSYQKKPDLKVFYKKRITRLLIPYLLISIPYYIYKNYTTTAFMDGSFNLSGFIKDLFGYSFWFEGSRTTWFVHAIIIMYIFFPLFYNIIKKNIIFAISLLIFSYLFIVLSYLCFSNHHLFSIAICRFPVFIVGMLFFKYNIGLTINNNKRYIILFILYLALFIFVFPIRKHIPVTLLWLFYITFTIPIIYIIEYISEKIKKNGICSFVGLFSLEIYLIHVMILNILNWHNYINKFSFYLYILVPLLAIFLSWIVSKISKYIAKKLIKI